MTKNIIGQFSDCKVLVLGDLMVDHYIWGTVKRISPEAPVPVVEVNSESVRLGGAGNVLNNILGLGGEVLLCSVIGSDDSGSWLSRRVAEKGASLDGLIVEADRPTTKKTRIIAHQQQVVRFDHEKKLAITEKTEQRLLDTVLTHLPQLNCLVISDYAKGVITRPMLEVILPAALKAGVPVVVDPKVNHFPYYKKVTLVTPNHLEASQASGIHIEDDASLHAAGERILQMLACEAALITRGEHGMSLFEHGGKVTHIPTEAKAVYDVTGAGDTVASTLAVALATKMSLLDAARLSNIAAGIVVGIVGTAPIEKTLLQKALDAD